MGSDRISSIMPSGEPVWPEFWKKDELLGVKASLSIGKWNAQWMQNPTSEEGALIKREWWQKWEADEPPHLYHIIQSYDTAFMKKEIADYSAITTWGVFYKNEDSGPQLILLDSVKDRFEFPELRRVAMEQYRYWNPETVIIESKASGLPLTYELRKLGIPVINFTPSKGNDKHTRVNSVAPLFESGCIWAPTNQAFAEEVIEECAAFPYGDHDDLVDSMTQAVMRFRQGGFIEHPEDAIDEPLPQPKGLLLMGKLLQLIGKLFGKNAISKTLGTRTNVIKLPSNEKKRLIKDELNIEAASDLAAQKVLKEAEDLIADIPKMNDQEVLTFTGNLQRLDNKINPPSAEVLDLTTKKPVTGEGL